MTDFRFYHPIEVRYGDLDPQGHLNNAKFLTYMEQARVNFVRHLGLWSGGSFFDFGFILAEVQVTFLSPIHFGHQVQVGVCVTRLGQKSLDMEYQIAESQSGVIFATGKSVLVAYDYHLGKTIPIPADWRHAMQEFDNLPGK